MATDPKATTEERAATAGIPADAVKKAAEGEGVAKEDVLAVVTKGADGKPRVTHYTGEEWKAYVAKVAKGEEKVPDGAQTVRLKDGKVVGEPAALTQEDVVAAPQIAAAKQSAAAAFEALPDDANGKVAMVMLDKDGKAVGQPRVFKSQEELAAFIQKDGEGMAVGEGQRMAMARIGADGKVNADQVVVQGQAGPQGFKAHMDALDAEQKAAQKEQEAKGSKDWLSTFMEKAMESGNMAMMAIAALVMVMSNRREGGREGGEMAEGQPPAREYDGEKPGAPSTAAGATQARMEIQKVDAAPGGMEHIKVSGMTAEQVAQQLGLGDRPDVVKQIADSMGKNGGMVVMDVEGAGGTLPAPSQVAAVQTGQDWTVQR